MMYRFILAAAAFIMSVSCVRSSAADKIKAGDAVPDFTLESEIYGSLSIEELRGKVVYLCFFATWCPPCQLELAAIQERMYPRFSDEADFRLVVVGREHTDADLAEYNETKRFTFPLYPDPEREVYSLFADESIPRAYLIDRDGTVVDAVSGFDSKHFDAVIGKAAELLGAE